MISPWWSVSLACIGVLGLYLAGRKDRRGWAVGVVAQVLWVWYAISTRQWGFLISCLGYGSVYLRNWWAWREEPQHRAKRRRLSARELLAFSARRRGMW